MMRVLRGIAASLATSTVERSINSRSVCLNTHALIVIFLAHGTRYILITYSEESLRKMVINNR